MAETGALVHLGVNGAPLEAAAGSRITVRLRASCAAALDRSGIPVVVTAPDGSQATHVFAEYDGEVSETGGIAFEVPPRVGEHVWRFVLQAHELGGIRYEDTVLTVSVRAKPQTTSLAAWDIPSPIVTGERFTVKVGAKSAADSELKGRGVELLHGGVVVARAVLGDAPWPGTAALYWAEVTLVAPAEEGIASWSVRFDARELDLPHEGASSSFSAAVVRPPEHKLTVKVIERDTARPVDAALVRLGAYRAETGRSGLAEIQLPRGRYELNIWKAGFDIAPTTLDFERDVSIEIKAMAVPEEDPDARWKM